MFAQEELKITNIPFCIKKREEPEVLPSVLRKCKTVELWKSGDLLVFFYEYIENFCFQPARTSKILSFKAIFSFLQKVCFNFWLLKNLAEILNENFKNSLFFVFNFSIQFLEFSAFPPTFLNNYKILDFVCDGVIQCLLQSLFFY